jgi:hypothetical protein
MKSIIQVGYERGLAMVARIFHPVKKKSRTIATEPNNCFHSPDKEGKIKRNKVK